MELDVRVANARARADEAAGLEMVGSAEAAPPQQPMQSDQPAGDEAGRAIERDRLFRGDLEIKFEMVLQVFADAPPVGDHLDAKSAQFRRRTDA